jgi:hypothetical protein
MYSLEFYENIIIDQNTIELPDAILNNIKQLHIALNINPEQNNSLRSNNNRRSKLDSNEWKKKEVFKATVITKKEGPDKLLNEVKTFLNKLSVSTYDNHSQNIIEIIDRVLEDTENTEEYNNDIIKQIINMLILVSCQNKFYSNLYAKLYKQIINKHPFFTEQINTMYSNYLSSVTDIEIVDSSKDYNKFCEINKQNEKRRSSMIFIVNLYKEDVIKKENVTTLISKICDCINSSLLDKEHIELVNELTEIINVFVVNMQDILKNNSNNWSNILERVHYYSTCKTKDFPGISSRTMFKYMDLLELVK